MKKVLYILSGICFVAFVVSFLAIQAFVYIFPSPYPLPDGISPAEIARIREACYWTDAFVECGNPTLGAIVGLPFMFVYGPLFAIGMLVDGGVFSDDWKTIALVIAVSIPVAAYVAGAVAFVPWTIASICRRLATRGAGTPGTPPSGPTPPAR